MKILSFNTSGVGTQMSLKTESKTSYLEVPFSKHSETFFPLLENFLHENNVKLSDIDVFGVVVGPGSFTGIRIGLSVVKMFSYVYNKPCVAVNALNVLAYNNNSSNQKVCAVINAGAGLLYYQIFGENKQPLTTERICTFAQFKKIQTKFNDVKIVYYNNEEKKYICDFLDEFLQKLTAKSLEECVYNAVKEKHLTKYQEITPLYIRLSQAEISVLDGDLKVEKATKENLQEIMEIEKTTSADDLPWSENAFLESFNNSSFECFIIKENEKNVGFLAIMNLGVEYEILRIVTTSKFRGQGVAIKLLDFLFKKAQEEGVKEIFLEVNQFNYPAMLLYEKTGFKVVGERVDYYSKGQNALIMRKDINLE